MQSLQSTLNAALGNACLATLYAAFTAVCIPGPRLVQYFDPKWAMVLGGSAYVFMILANIPILHLTDHLGAQYAIGLPFNFLVGVGAPLLWTGQALYLARSAELHTKHIGGSVAEQKATLSEFNATFFAMFQANFTNTPSTLLCSQTSRECVGASVGQCETTWCKRRLV